jgi:hypothetical protein
MQIGDACDFQVHDKMMFDSPLVATGVLKIQHRVGFSDSDHSQSLSSEGGQTSNQRTNATPGLLLGIHSSFQSAITHQLQIASKGEVVSQDVVRFLYGDFSLLAPTEETWIVIPINIFFMSSLQS